MGARRPRVRGVCCHARKTSWIQGASAPWALYKCALCVKCAVCVCLSAASSCASVPRHHVSGASVPRHQVLECRVIMSASSCAAGPRPPKQSS